jgi:hypothetical protein
MEHVTSSVDHSQRHVMRSQDKSYCFLASHEPLAVINGTRYVFHPYANDLDTCFYYSDRGWLFAKHQSHPYTCTPSRASAIPRQFWDHLTSFTNPHVYTYQATHASPSLLSSVTPSESSPPRIADQLSRATSISFDLPSLTQIQGVAALMSSSRASTSVPVSSDDVHMRTSAAPTDSISQRDLLAAINQLEDRFLHKDGDGAPTSDSAALSRFTILLDEADDVQPTITAMKNYDERRKFGIKSPDAWRQAGTAVTAEERSAALLSTLTPFL